MLLQNRKERGKIMYFIGLYLFAIYHKNVIIYIYIYKLVKSRIDKNNNVSDVKYITTYTDLVYH